MIVTGQYPTALEWPLQNFAATVRITTETPGVEALNIDDPELTDSYWIGWIAYDDLPGAFKLSRYTLDAENDRISLTDVTRVENVDVCLVSGASTGPNPSINQSVTLLYKNDVWAGFSRMAYTYLTRNMRFLNSIDINTILNSNTYIILSIDIDSNTEAYASITLTISDLYNKSFSAAVTSADINTTSGPPVPSGISFDVTDANIDGTLQTVESGGHTITYHASCFGLSRFDRPITTSGTAGNYYNPVPAVRVHDDMDRTYLLGGSRYYQTATSWSTGGFRINLSSMTIDPANSDFYDTDAGTLIGGYVGSVAPSDVSSLNGAYGFVAPENGNFAIQGTGRGIAVLRRMYTWYEIYTTLSYLMRYCINNTYTTDSDKYYPHISANNQFLGELINGESDRDKLRPWQISGTTLDADTNDYTQEDKPPYIPAEGDDTKNKIGDRIGWNFANLPAGNATGLYTLYALTQDHVSRLGAKLWSTLNNGASDFWSNLVFAQNVFAETGSLDIRDVLDFIVSLRIYPIALDQLQGFYNSGAPSIRIGSGRVALDLSSGVPNTGIMGRYTVSLSGGAVYVPTHYGDFRDIDGVSTTVYIPYIGNININTAEVIGCTLNLSYLLDLTSGNITAYLLVLSNEGYYPIGIYHGTVGADIPLNASQGNGVFLRSIARATMGATSLVSSGGDPVSMIRTAGGMVGDLAGGGQTPNTLNAGATNFSGFAAPQIAYLQIRRRKYAYTARNFPAAEMGRRTYGVKVLGTLSGFTVCDAVDVSGIPAPADIQTDIKQMLESGVYL